MIYIYISFAKIKFVNKVLYMKVGCIFVINFVYTIN